MQAFFSALHAHMVDQEEITNNLPPAPLAQSGIQSLKGFLSSSSPPPVSHRPERVAARKFALNIRLFCVLFCFWQRCKKKPSIPQLPKKIA